MAKQKKIDELLKKVNIEILYELDPIEIGNKLIHFNRKSGKYRLPNLSFNPSVEYFDRDLTTPIKGTLTELLLWLLEYEISQKFVNFNVLASNELLGTFIYTNDSLVLRSVTLVVNKG